MSALTFVLLSVAGGAGAAIRLMVDGFIRDGVKRDFPFGTTIINVSGSLLLGLVTGLAIYHGLPAQWHAILGAGFLGGYTTFSTASFETIRLIQSGRYGAATFNSFGMLLLSAGAAAGGLWLGSL